MAQLRRQQAQNRAMMMLDFIAENWGISKHDFEPKIRKIYSIPDITLNQTSGTWFTEPLAVLRHWQEEGILHVISRDDRRDRIGIEINWNTWNEREYIFFELTNKGVKFHQTGEVPPSKYTNRRPRKSGNGSNISLSIAARIIKKRRSIREPKDIESAKEKIAQTIASRQGQEKFRQDLINNYGVRCLITGPNIENILEAAHIKPYSEGGTFKISNGLLLRADIHTLFDLGLIAIDTKDMSVIVSPKLENTEYHLLIGKKLQLPMGKESPDKEALNTHRISVNL